MKSIGMFLRSNWNVHDDMATLMWEIVCVTSIEYVPERISNVKANVLDSGKLQQHTGWEAQTSFDEGLLHSREWTRGFFG